MVRINLPINFTSLNTDHILDLQENDTVKHNADLSAHIPVNCVAVLISAKRMSGTGRFEVFPNPQSGGFSFYADTTVSAKPVLVGISTDSQYFTWKNSIANDDWDIFLWGYVTEGKLKE